MSKVTIEIIDNINTNASLQLSKLLESIIKYAIIEEAGREDFELSLTITNNKEMRCINKEQRNIDAFTDVLSFPLIDFSSNDEILEYSNPETDDIMLGDIVLSLEQAEIQAKDYGHSLEREAAYLCVHGVLHLFGYDHMQEEDKLNMRSREEEILKSYGLTR